MFWKVSKTTTGFAWILRFRNMSFLLSGDQCHQLECCGLGDPSVVPNLKYLAWYYNPYILFFSEIFVHWNKIKEFRYIFGFDSCFCIDRVGRGGGLDLYWGSFIKHQIVDYSNNHITFDLLDVGKGI